MGSIYIPVPFNCPREWQSAAREVWLSIMEVLLSSVVAEQPPPVTQTFTVYPNKDARFWRNEYLAVRGDLVCLRGGRSSRDDVLHLFLS
jgi:hypothetical protein